MEIKEFNSNELNEPMFHPEQTIELLIELDSQPDLKVVEIEETYRRVIKDTLEDGPEYESYPLISYKKLFINFANLSVVLEEYFRSIISEEYQYSLELTDA